MEILLRCQLDRIEGKNMGGELVAEELASDLEALGEIEVEDSQYEIISVEPVGKVKESKKNSGEFSIAMAQATEAYFTVRPIILGGLGDERVDVRASMSKEELELDLKLQALFFTQGARDVELKGRVILAKLKKLKSKETSP